MAMQPRSHNRSGPPSEPPLVGGRAHVIGPVCLDLVFSGLPAAPRPGTEVRAGDLGLSPGGVANVAVAMARLGVDVGLSAVFADDAFGQYLWTSLADEGIDLDHSVRVGGWNSPVTSSVAVDRERSMVTYEEVPPVAATGLLPEGYQANAVVVSLADADPSWVASLHQVAPLLFADVAWDEGLGQGQLAAQLAAVDVFMPNAAEAMAATGCPTPEEAAAQLAQNGPLVVVKDGSAGAVAFDPRVGTPLRVAGLPVDARDTTGAGDIFDAGFVYATLAGWPLERRLRFANLCAAESVKLVGGSLAAPCWRDLAAFWAGLEDPEVRQKYAFLADVMVDATARRDCQRSFPALVRSGATGPIRDNSGLSTGRG